MYLEGSLILFSKIIVLDSSLETMNSQVMGSQLDLQHAARIFSQVVSLKSNLKAADCP